MKNLAITLLVTLCCNASFSQYSFSAAPKASNGQNIGFIPAAPDAATLGLFGEVPVGNYTGIAAIAVPFHSIKYKELEVGIGISYHASAIRPELFPGSVGLGWALNAGGSITRVIKGLPDYDENSIKVPQTTFVPTLINPTAEPKWSTDSTLLTYMKLGYMTPDDISCPDEYYYNFNGIAGRFYVDNNGQFRVRTEQGDYLKVEVDIRNNVSIPVPHLAKPPGQPDNSTDHIGKGRMAYSFTITDNRGVKYTFGGTDESIEFSRTGHNTADFSSTTINNLIQPITWNLTSIESPNHYKIKFNYKRGISVTKVPFSEVQYFIWNNSKNQIPEYGTTYDHTNMERSTLVNICYLTSIVSPVDSIDFTTSPAIGQLQYPTDPDMPIRSAPGESLTTNRNLFTFYSDILNTDTESLLPEKLDRITVFNRLSQVYRIIDFQYTNDTTERLKLLSVNVYGENAAGSGQKYQFSYNPLKLPPYMAKKTDNYGYYNGRALGQLDSHVVPDTVINRRMPDSNYVQAEMLQKIIYPTGGFTQFAYEPHYYRNYATIWPFAIQSEAQNKAPGGIRIKSITSYSANGAVASSKRYYYVKDYKSGGTVSSGVLSYKSTYFDTYTGKTMTPPYRFEDDPQGYYSGTLSGTHWSSNPLFPLGETKGNHVTYSEVTEVNADSSYVVYKYKNYDNGYNDKAPVNQYSDNTSIKLWYTEDDGTSMNLERGQLLQTESYNAANVMVQKITNTYNDDTLRFNQNVRVLTETANNMPIFSGRVVATLIYTYYPFLKNVRTAVYTSTDSVITNESRTYDSLYRMVKKEITISSDGKQRITINRYPKDMVDSGTVTPYRDMVSRGMVGFPVQTEHWVDSVKLTTEINTFGKIAQDTSLILPELTQTQFRKRQVDTRSRNLLYNSAGNVLSGLKEKGATTCYVWSYKNTYPIAIIKNANYTTVQNVLGGKINIDTFANKIPLSDQEVVTFLDTLRKAPGLSTAMITTYTYSPLFGLTSETDENGKSTYYEYDKMGRLTVIRDNERNIIKQLCYNYFNDLSPCKATIASQKATYARSTVKSDICNYQSGNFIQTLDLYSMVGYSPAPVFDTTTRNVDNIEKDSSIVRPGYFQDAELTAPVQDGFYILYSRLNSPLGKEYFYVKQGKVQYINSCSNSDPYTLKYTDSLYTPNYMCGTNPLQEAAAYGNGSFTQGQHLYADYGLSVPVNNGYYSINGTYFKVKNGIIDTVKTCAPTVYSFSFKYHATSLTLCTDFRLTSTYYCTVSTPVVGSVLFTDSALTSFAPTGRYSDGIRLYQVASGGLITSASICF